MMKRLKQLEQQILNLRKEEEKLIKEYVYLLEKMAYKPGEKIKLRRQSGTSIDTYRIHRVEIAHAQLQESLPRIEYLLNISDQNHPLYFQRFQHEELSRTQ